MATHLQLTNISYRITSYLRKKIICGLKSVKVKSKFSWENGKDKSKIHPITCPKGTEGVDVDLYPF